MMLCSILAYVGCFIMMPTDLDAMSRTVWGEGRSEPYAAKKAIAHVIINRWEKKHRREHTLAGVSTEPSQFSCWNLNDPNRAALEVVTLHDSTFRDSMRASLEAYNEALMGVDPTFGSTHYHTRSIEAYWARGKIPVVIIGEHKFYNNVK